MRFRAAQLAAVAVAIAASASSGCRRSPLTESTAPDAGPDLSTDAPRPGDGSDGALATPLDTPREIAADLAPADTGNADGPTDPSAGDARSDSADTSDARTDAPGNAGADAPADTTDSAADRPA